MIGDLFWLCSHIEKVEQENIKIKVNKLAKFLVICTRPWFLGGCSLFTDMYG